MSNDATPISDDEVVALAQQILRQSREENEQLQRAEQTPRELQQPGITIDLGHKNIVRLPDEVVDVIRTEIERLALSHNLLTTLPSRLVECKRLRYLNVRYNSMREIPDAIFGMPSLEILDVSRNRITHIPKKIAHLTSLKVLAIAKNRIEELPLCLGDITSLQVLKLDGNPLKFPPPDVCRINDNTPSPSNENERDAVIATQVKKFMRQHAQARDKRRVDVERLRIESSGDESNPETPRPSRRANGMRFPVRPSVGSVDGFADSRPASPGMAPPIPIRSHYRNQSSQNTTLPRRPNISPLVLSNISNERNRSQSEGSGASSTHRQKRMGIYTNKTSDLGAVDELKRTNHFRGFSQGYLLSGNGPSNPFSGPATAVGYGDTGTVRSLANRPLSDVREHKRGSRSPDVVVEAAKNFLYAISQLHDTVSQMMQSIKKTGRTKHGMRRKEEFRRYFSATYIHIRALHDCLRRFETFTEEDEDDANRLSKEIYKYSLNCLELFTHVNLSIAENRVGITHNADPRFLRSYLLLQQGSLIEMRNACSVLGAEFSSTSSTRRPNGMDITATVRAPPMKSRRYPTSPMQRSGHFPPPAVMLHSNETSRTNTLTSISAATPRSGESFSTLATAMSRSNTLTSSFDEQEEEFHFERVYAKLRSACDTCITHIQEISALLRGHLEALRKDPDNDDYKVRVLASLIDKSNMVLENAVPLAERLSQMQLKDRDSRTSPLFWQQCMNFIKAWGELATSSMAEGRNLGLLTPEVKSLMKPLHRTVKEASVAIQDSPFSHLTSTSSMGNPPLSATPLGGSFTSRTQHPRFAMNRSMTSSAMSSLGGINTSVPSSSSLSSAASAYPHGYPPSAAGGLGSGSTGGFGTPVPATPLLSAALGAAAQATVPNTPSFGLSGGLGYGDMASEGTKGKGMISFSERADKFLSQPGRRV